MSLVTDYHAAHQRRRAKLWPVPKRVYTPPVLLVIEDLPHATPGIEPPPPPPPNATIWAVTSYARLEGILEAVAAVTGVELDRIRGRQKYRTARSVVNARFLFYFVARQATGSSYERIVRTIARLDHTSAMNGYRMVRRYWPVYAQAVADVEARLAVQE